MRSPQEIAALDFSSEVVFKTAKSGGPGGQHVNKVNTKVVLIFDINGSQLLDEAEKERIRKKLPSHLNAMGHLQITVQESRSQLQNKTIASQKLNRLLSNAFVKVKRRKPTKPSKSAVKKRLENKKKRSEKKQWRKKPYN